MITMSEIAKLTHVSQPTVSRVLNGSQKVDPAIRERVLACAREHDYQLNALAKGLQGRRTMLLGLLLPEASDGVLAGLARGVEAEARQAGYSVILLNSGNDGAQERAGLDVARRYRADGVLAVPVRTDGGAWPDGGRRPDIPAVVLARPAAGVDAVYADLEKAGAMVAEHAVERGYRRFLFVGQAGERKNLGFRQALERLHLAERADSVACEDDRQLTHFLEAWFRRPGGRTAVFAGSDLSALRVLSALRELEIHVPRQAGVVGFGDTPACRYLHPALSSVSVPVEEMARQAVSRLLRRMDRGGEEEPAQSLALPPQLVQRESV